MSAEEHAGGPMRQGEITIRLVCTDDITAKTPNHTGSIFFEVPNAIAIAFYILAEIHSFCIDNKPTYSTLINIMNVMQTTGRL